MGDETPIVAQTIQPRIRIGTDISTRGIITWSVTLETHGDHPDDVLAQHDYLVAQLKQRYPVKKS